MFKQFFDKWGIAVIFGMIGIIMGSVSIGVYMSTQNMLAHATKVSGTVVDLQYRRGSKGGGVYSPIVKFRTVEGKDIQDSASFGSDPPSHKVGDIVEVVYDPQSPEKSWQINSFWDLYFLPALFGLFGVIFTSVGLIVGYFTLVGRPVPGTSAAERANSGGGRWKKRRL
jgi:hypothetical protein